MDQKTLRERLAKLHAELANAHKQDPATRESLGEILPDVKRMVDQPEGAAASSADNRSPIAWRESPCSSRSAIPGWRPAHGS